MLTLSNSFAAISVVWYFIHGRRNFTGPPVPQDDGPMIQGAVVDDSERNLAGETEVQKVPKME